MDIAVLIALWHVFDICSPSLACAHARTFSLSIFRVRIGSLYTAFMIYTRQIRFIYETK